MLTFAMRTYIPLLVLPFLFGCPLLRIGPESSTETQKRQDTFSTEETISVHVSTFEDIPLQGYVIPKESAAGRTFNVTEPPKKGALRMMPEVPGRFEYVPNRDVSGEDSFRFETYNNTSIQQGTVTITIIPGDGPSTAFRKASALREGMSAVEAPRSRTFSAPPQRDRFAFKGIDVTVPPLTLFTAVPAAGPTGDIELLIDFPSDMSGVQRVTLHRQGGAEPVACSAQTIVRDFLAFDDARWTDALARPGAYYSYRACVWDTQGRLAFGHGVSGVRTGGSVIESSSHLAFVASSAEVPEPGGVEGASATCQSLAARMGLNGSWKAIFPDEVSQARDRISVSGRVFNTAGARVAHDAEEFWNGAIESIGYTDRGLLAPREVHFYCINQ